VVDEVNGISLVQASSCIRRVLCGERKIEKFFFNLYEAKSAVRPNMNSNVVSPPLNFFSVPRIFLIASIIRAACSI